MRYLAKVGFLVAGIALLLGWGGHGSSPLIPGAQRWMFLGGLAVLPSGVWHTLHRSARMAFQTQDWPPKLTGTFLLSVALASIGGGLHANYHDDRWLALLLPGALTSSYLAAWLVSTASPHNTERRWGTCVLALVFALAGFWLSASALT